MVYPLIPLYLTTRLGATPAIVGIIEGIAESIASFLKIFAGYWSDKIGRRKPLAIAGYSSSTLGKLLLFFSSSWLWVLAGRGVDRFGKGIRTAPRDALIAEAVGTNSYGQAFGLHRALDTLGAALGVLLAYYFLTTSLGNYQLIFLYALIPAALGVGMLFLVREKGRPAWVTTPVSFKFRSAWKSLSPRLKAFLGVVFLFALGNSSNQFLLLRAQNIGFAPQNVILLYLTYNLTYSLFSYPAGKFSDKIGRRKVIVLGYLAYGFVYLGFALAQRAPFLWLLFGIYGLYAAFTEGVEKALVADLAPPAQRATLIGLHATLVGIGLLPASLFAGFLWNFLGAPAPFYLGSILGLSAALGIWLVLGRA